MQLKSKPNIGRLIRWTDERTGANIFNIQNHSLIFNFCAIRRSLVMVITAVLVLGTASFAVLAQEEEEPGTADGELSRAVALFNQGQDLHEKNDLNGAIARYRNALTILPEFPEAEFQLGVAHLALGKLDDAQRSFRRAVELRPDWSLARNGLASVLLLSDKSEHLGEARQILEKILEADPRNPPALAALAELSVKTNSPPDILKDLLTQITPLTEAANPTAVLWTSRARIEWALGLTDAAHMSLGRALAVEPDHRNALLFAADIAIASGDLNRAKALAKTLEKRNMGSESSTLLNANIMAAEGKFEDALALISSIKPPTAASAALKSRILANGSTTAAELEKQLTASPQNAAILGRLCSIFRKDDPAKALEHCRRASEIEPGNINHAIGFGAALVQARRFDQAVNVLKKVVEAAPENSTARANLGTALVQLKRYPEAKAEFQWLVRAQPSAPTAYFFLGVIHDHLGEYIDAVANYQQYLKLSDPVKDRLDIDRVNLRMPALQKFVRKAGGKRN